MFGSKKDGGTVRKDLLRSMSGRYTFSPAVKAAFIDTEREKYVVKGHEKEAHKDRPLPLPGGQTISAMHMVLMMLSEELGAPRAGEHTLDVGTGSGYAAAVLARSIDAGLGDRPPVVSVEVIEDLADFGRRNLANDDLGSRVIVSVGDAVSMFEGETERFDLIQTAAAPAYVPKPLVDLLRPRGRLIIPVGRRGSQILIRVRKDEAGVVTKKNMGRVAFVPLVHRQCDAYGEAHH